MVRVDPSIAEWEHALRNPRAVVATGHQAFLWHPGILAKILAMRAAADRFGCRPLYVVVDQDAHDAMTLDLPSIAEDRLTVASLRLGAQQPDVPTGFHPPVPLDLPRDLPPPIRDALLHATGQTLAQQMTAAMRTLIEPITGTFDVMYVSDLPRDARYATLVRDMIDDAPACAAAYNAALTDTGLHGVAPLAVTSASAELPLWACPWNQPRRRVFVRDGELDAAGDLPLLPKALTLSAAMRSTFCDLFIHGLGGEIYDRATEAWWRNWRGQPLNPRAVATADLRLSFDVPVATRDDLARAVWRRHHLLHNGDPRKKSPLLAKMALAEDRAEKAGIFRQIHAIAPDPDAMKKAEDHVARARAGLANAALARRRDWCVGLYPLRQLRHLRDAVAATAKMPA